MPLDVKGFETQREELNKVKVEVMQLRNRLSRQKRLCGLNERSLIAGKNRSHKVEGLLLEMQMDLKNLKERLQDELRELGKFYCYVRHSNMRDQFCGFLFFCFVNQHCSHQSSNFS